MSKAVVLDTETTGINPQDELIELGLILFEYSPKDGEILDIIETYQGYNEPKRKYIPDNIVQLTDLTWELVQGEFIDKNKVMTLITRADMLIAHNSRFDRYYLSKVLPEVKRMKWKCTMLNIPWRKLGVGSLSLQNILNVHGIIQHNKHHALSDARSILELLQIRARNGKRYMSYLTK